MMHAADQSAALAERVARVSAGGVLLLQYHSLATIVRLGQWNALRHGHYAYYSTAALVRMLAAATFSPRTAWRFDLYGGTVLLAATREADSRSVPNGHVRSLLAEDARLEVGNPAVVGALQRYVSAHAERLHRWLLAQRSVGARVIGYGAASRAVALLRQAHVDRTLLPAVADASRAKQGLRMPGTDIPIVAPGALSTYQPDAVLLFLPDLLTEVRTTLPDVEASGGTWVDAEAFAIEDPLVTGNDTQPTRR
jgi:C-methyltransferase C-terminal domain